MTTKFIFRAQKPHSINASFFCCHDLVRELKDEGYIITARRWKGLR